MSDQAESPKSFWNVVLDKSKEVLVKAADPFTQGWDTVVQTASATWKDKPPIDYSLYANSALIYRDSGKEQNEAQNKANQDLANLKKEQKNTNKALVDNRLELEKTNKQISEFEEKIAIQKFINKTFEQEEISAANLSFKQPGFLESLLNQAVVEIEKRTLLENEANDLQKKLEAFPDEIDAAKQRKKEEDAKALEYIYAIEKVRQESLTIQERRNEQDRVNRLGDKWFNLIVGGTSFDFSNPGEAIKEVGRLVSETAFGKSGGALFDIVDIFCDGKREKFFKVEEFKRVWGSFVDDLKDIWDRDYPGNSPHNEGGGFKNPSQIFNELELPQVQANITTSSSDLEYAANMFFRTDENQIKKLQSYKVPIGSDENVNSKSRPDPYDHIGGVEVTNFGVSCEKLWPEVNMLNNMWGPGEEKPKNLDTAPQFYLSYMDLANQRDRFSLEYTGKIQQNGVTRVLTLDEICRLWVKWSDHYLKINNNRLIWFTNTSLSLKLEITALRSTKDFAQNYFVSEGINDQGLRYIHPNPSNCYKDLLERVNLIAEIQLKNDVKGPYGLIAPLQKNDFTFKEGGEEPSDLFANENYTINTKRDGPEKLGSLYHIAERDDKHILQLPGRTAAVYNMLKAGPHLYSNMFDVFFVWNPQNYKTRSEQLNKIHITEKERLLFSQACLATRINSITIPTVKKVPMSTNFLMKSVERISGKIEHNQKSQFNIDGDEELYIIDLFQEMAGHKQKINQQDIYLKKENEGSKKTENQPKDDSMYLKRIRQFTDAEIGGKKLSTNKYVIFNELAKTWNWEGFYREPEESADDPNNLKSYRSPQGMSRDLAKNSTKSANQLGLCIIVEEQILSPFLTQFDTSSGTISDKKRNKVLPEKNFWMFENVKILGTSTAISFKRESADKQSFVFDFIFRRCYKLNAIDEIQVNHNLKWEPTVEFEIQPNGPSKEPLKPFNGRPH